jgi:peptidoglycan L-alanyl-D-glutamate endopeptidase CwlK
VIVDPTPGHLAKLAPRISFKAEQFIDHLRFRGLPIIITSSLRTPSQQRVLVSQGRSTLLQSKHLDGLAFDVDIAGVGRNAVPAWIWDSIGPIGESFGLTWGGRWKSFRDVGHFEI